MEHIAPTPAAAAGMERVVFFDDFDSSETVDMNNEQTPDFHWYVDRAYGRPPMRPEEIEWHTEESFVRLKGENGCGLSSVCSHTGEGFSWKYGYIEARIRIEEIEKIGETPPLFYMLALPDYLGKAWVDNGLISVFTCPKTKNKQGKRAPYYAGALFHYQRSWERDRDGKPIVRSASNLVNATGYHDWFTFLDEEWHTYGLLWEPGHIAWFMDGKEMHSVRFGVGELPRHYYRNQPTPLQPIEGQDLKYASRQWLGAYTVFNDEPMLIDLCARAEWPMDVDWVRVWQK